MQPESARMESRQPHSRRALLWCAGDTYVFYSADAISFQNLLYANAVSSAVNQHSTATTAAADCLLEATAAAEFKLLCCNALQYHVVLASSFTQNGTLLLHVCIEFAACTALCSKEHHDEWLLCCPWHFGCSGTCHKATIQVQPGLKRMCGQHTQSSHQSSSSSHQISSQLRCSQQNSNQQSSSQ